MKIKITEGHEPSFIGPDGKTIPSFKAVYLARKQLGMSVERFAKDMGTYNRAVEDWECKSVKRTIPKMGIMLLRERLKSYENNNR